MEESEEAARQCTVYVTLVHVCLAGASVWRVGGRCALGTGVSFGQREVEDPVGLADIAKVQGHGGLFSADLRQRGF